MGHSKIFHTITSPEDVRGYVAAKDFRDLSEDGQHEQINAAFAKALGVTNDEFSNADTTVYDLLGQVREYMAFDTTSAEKPLRLAAIGLALVVAIRERMEA
jgi:hypothetical protein